MKLTTAIMFFLFTQYLLGQIVSTPTGGVWNDTTTWIGNVVPNDSDNVVINGPVVIYEKAFCKDLLLSNAASLADSQSIESFDIAIKGNFINEGTVFSKSDQFNLLLYEDLHNKGNWDEQSNINITFSSLADHNIANDSSKIISVDNILLAGNGRKLILLTNINFKQTNFDLEYDTLVINDKEVYNLGGIFHNPVIKSNGGMFNNSNLWDCNVIGTLRTSGKTLVSGGNFMDTLIVVDTLTQSPSGYSWFRINTLINHGVVRCSQAGFFTIYIKNIINNGILEDGNSGGLLLPIITESLHNNGIWSCLYTDFNSSNNLYLSQTEGKYIGSDYIQVRSQQDTIFLLSDFNINSKVMGQENFLSVGEYTLSGINNYYLALKFISNNATLKNTYIINSNFEGNTTFDGMTYLAGQIYFTDTVMVKSIFKSYGSDVSTLSFENLINCGDIYNDGDGLYIEIKKDLRNEWNLRCNRLTFNGSVDQIITLYKPIKGKTYFVSNITGNEYQWYLNNQPLLGKTNSILQFDSLINNSAGVYSCRVISVVDTLFSRTISVDFLTDISENINSIIVTNYNLYQNYPNPFNPITTINFDLPKNGFVSLKIYDVVGSEIIKLIDNELEAGKHEVNFNANGLSSGVYFYRLEANDFCFFRKMILIK